MAVPNSEARGSAMAIQSDLPERGECRGHVSPLLALSRWCEGGTPSTLSQQREGGPCPSGLAFPRRAHGVAMAVVDVRRPATHPIS